MGCLLPTQIAQFAHDLLLEIRDWVNHVECDNIQVFPEVKWAQVLARALGVVQQVSSLPLACPLCFDRPDLLLSKYHC